VELDREYRAKTSKAAMRKMGGELQAVVGQFWGRLKATASQLTVDTTNLVAPPMLRSLSRASFTSSPQDMEQHPPLSRSQTEAVMMTRTASSTSFRGTSDNERALHGQIEELVKLLGEVQRKFGEGEIEKNTLKEENKRLRGMLTRVADVMGSTPVEELTSPESSGTKSSLSDEISEILSTTSSSASSISTCPESTVEEDLRTQLTEAQQTLNLERQANALLQQQLSTTEVELARTRGALFELRSKQVDAPLRERTPTPSIHSPKEPPSTPSLRELKLVVKTRPETPGSASATPGAASATSAGSTWTSWFGRG
jgi:hypothetical protein